MLRRRRDRRGLALMMVLSLLVLFLLMGISFLMVASQSEKGARAMAKVDRTGTQPRKLLDSALYQLVRDTNEINSSALAHSLLHDMYGDQWFFGQLTADAQLIGGTGGQFVEVTLPSASSAIINYYTGRVLTFASGRAKGISVRVVGYDPATKQFHVTRGELDNAALPQANDVVVVNGPAFAGTGFAYNGTNLGSEALQPHRKGGNNLGVYLAGGANESYDAVDFQNMALAAVIRDGTGVRIIPSFHRPALIRQSGGAPANAASPNARTVLRPLPGPDAGDAGPRFPAINLINGPWDVDNDNDGIPDSIWIDLGLPVQSTVDGRAVKPLFAILCVDLDGRLNLNLHGTEADFNASLVQSPRVTHQGLAGVSAAPAGTPNTSQMPRGFGYGPPEINLGHAITAADYQRLLQGAAGVPGRYGADGSPGRAGFDPLAQIKFFEHPVNYFNVRSTFNSPDDLNGWSALGLDDFGQARYAKPTVNTKQNTPYEVSMATDAPRGQYNTAAADQPFSVSEFERVLRANDLDSVALPARLWGLSAGLQNDVSLRGIVTTDSYDLPVAPPISPGRLLLDDLSGLSTLDLLNLVPNELLKGSRMDINRPFGDGQDNNNNQVFDEAGEFPAVNLRQLYAQQMYVLARTLIGRTTTLTPLQIREIAQWSVNVVDFRDADAIMTRFDYDSNPFDGWTPNAFVWGAERPELLISESLAWHDRRTYDMDNPNRKVTDTNNPDDHFDQWWIPRGAFFVELFNPWAGDENQPGEFYSAGGSFANGVILDKAAPGGAPVWRMIVVRGNDMNRDPDEDFTNRPTAERTVYFRPPPPAMRSPGVFFSNDTTLPLTPGGYAVIGSAGIDRDQNRRFRTNLAGWMATAPNGDTVSTMMPADFSLTDFYSKTDTRQLYFERIAAPSVHHRFRIVNNGFGLDEAWSSRPIGIPIEGLTISEPIGGYASLIPDPMTNVPTQIDDDTVIHPALDTPLDLERPTTTAEDRADIAAVTKIGTTPSYRMIHLQRLADPTQAYDPANPNTNPYLTIDSMSVDLTAFNGVVPRAIASSEKFNGVDVDEVTIHHASLQRGDQEGPTEPSFDMPYERRQLWKHQINNDPSLSNYPSNAPGDAGGHLFGFKIRNSLGSLNSSVRFPTNGGFRPGARAANAATGFPEIYNGNALNGLPPFPLLTWNNRPFVSQYELMLVPKSRSSRLLHDYSVDVSNPAPGAYNPYDSLGNSTQVFGHLPNFFDINAAPQELQLHRILDYTHVPSRFVGTETILNQTRFDTWNHQLNLYRFGFNKVPTFREPGKVNINTIFDSRVWQALMDGDNVNTGHGGPTFGELVASRRGYNEANIGGTAADILAPNNSFPTYFANPVRMGKTGQLVPNANMQREDIHCTLMRAFPDLHPDSAKRRRPMFELTRNVEFEHLHLDNRRNPVMRDHALTRVANLVTTRSNVYAIWITVGYFEVDKITGQLGAEKGSDTGDISRHRAFYMVDRSIPVAFQPGENHNVDRCILVRRFIE